MSTTVAASCPSCRAVVPPGVKKCRRCGLEVAKMAGYAAAMRAAQQRGIQEPTVELRKPFPWHIVSKVVIILFVVALVGGIGYLGWKWFGPKPPRYLQFPPTPQEAAAKFTENVAGGDATYDKAYFYIADSVRSTKENVDDRGDYVQIFNIINNYLTDEIGAGWIGRTTFEPDPADPAVVLAHVGLETLHIRTAQQTPADKIAAQGQHFGILGIDELDVNYVGEMRKNSFVSDYLRAMGGEAAGRNWEVVMGGNAANLRRAPALYRKILILAALRDPRAANGRAVVQADVFVNRGKDAVVRARLEAIVQDERYDRDVREWARKVLDNRLDETDKAAVGVDD